MTDAPAPEDHYPDEDQTREIVAAAPPLPALTFNAKQVALIKETIAKGTSDAELALFVAVAQRTGLDPFARQIYAVMRGKRGERKTMTIQTGIDGYRVLAKRTGKYKGLLGPEWCGPDGKWVDVWLDLSAPPAAARVGVLHADYDAPVWGTVTYGAFLGRRSDGSPNDMWANAPAEMLAKQAEALALRRAFPAETEDLGAEDLPLDAEAREVPLEQIEAPEETEAPPDSEPLDVPEPPQAIEGEWADLPTFQNVGELYTWALKKHEMSREDVLKLLDCQDGRSVTAYGLDKAAQVIAEHQREPQQGEMAT